jgi:hypothetical protein
MDATAVNINSKGTSGRLYAYEIASASALTVANRSLRSATSTGHLTYAVEDDVKPRSTQGAASATAFMPIPLPSQRKKADKALAAATLPSEVFVSMRTSHPYLPELPADDFSAFNHNLMSAAPTWLNPCQQSYLPSYGMTAYPPVYPAYQPYAFGAMPWDNPAAYLQLASHEMAQLQANSGSSHSAELPMMASYQRDDPSIFYPLNLMIPGAGASFTSGYPPSSSSSTLHMHVGNLKKRSLGVAEVEDHAARKLSSPERFSQPPRYFG